MSRKTVLVVEDQRLNKAVATDILSKDYELLFAGNGREALELLDSGVMPDAMLLDINMPVMDGYEVLKEMDKRELIGQIPVLVVSQEDREQTEIKALKLGASDYVTKPYNDKVLRKRLGNLVQMKAAAALVKELERDSVTQLYNKAAFCQYVSDMLEEYPDTEFDIVAVDVKHFKMFNESYGFTEGDKVLRYIGENLKKFSAGDLNVCAREYGDRFLVLAERKRNYLARIHDQMLEVMDEYPLDMKIKLRFGVYRVDDKSLAVESMCDRALSAVKRSEGKYGDDTAYYDDSARAQMYLEQQITNEMVDALKNGEFQIFFQPKYDLFNEKMAGAEALVRWRHPKKGMIPPGQFIPVFEKNGFITELDMFVWEKTCELIEEWIKNDNKYVPVSVNVSRKDIYKENLPEIFTNLLKKYHLKPKHLHLEITETAYTENSEQLIKVVNDLKKAGFTIEMDDFGSGYSSLNMLAKLPIDVLKLDVKIIQSYGEQSNTRSIINFIMGLARWMNLYVVAEGVETQQQIDLLKSMDCNYVQGYYFSKPMFHEEFTEKLKKAEISMMPSIEDSINTKILVRDYHKDMIMLIIDDLAMNRAIMTDYFKDQFSIIEATDGKVAIDYFKKGGHADVILLDIFMPNVNGFQVLEELEGSVYTKSIPVIVTSQADDATIIRAIKAGAADFMTKPFTKEDAKLCVERVMAGMTGLPKRVDEEVKGRMTMMEKLSATDFLTGLWNQDQLQKKTDEYLQEFSDHRCNLVLIGVDNFNEVNNKLGHMAGDEVLQKIGTKLMYSFREGDVISRINGDEFGILMKAEMEKRELQRRMKAFHKSISMVVEDMEITCSAGVSRYPEDGSSYEELLQKAQRALSQAKRNGKNQSVIYASKYK